MSADEYLMVLLFIIITFLASNGITIRKHLSQENENPKECVSMTMSALFPLLFIIWVVAW